MSRYTFSIIKPGKLMRIYIRENEKSAWSGINITGEEARYMANALYCMADLADALDEETLSNSTPLKKENL